MDELSQFKKDLYQDIIIDSAIDEVFPEESFFDVSCRLLEDAGFIDNVEYSSFRDSRKGIKVDGYAWNELERTFCAIISDFSDDPDSILTLTKSEIKSLGERVTRFIEKGSNHKFRDTLDPSEAAYGLSHYLESLLEGILKFRIIVISDKKLSDRVKSLEIEPIQDLNTSIEVWDLQRLFELTTSKSHTEDFEVDTELLDGGLPVIKATNNIGGPESFLGIMPGSVLSAIYDKYGQRLLESLCALERMRM